MVTQKERDKTRECLEIINKDIERKTNQIGKLMNEMSQEVDLVEAMSIYEALIGAQECLSRLISERNLTLDILSQDIPIRNLLLDAQKNFEEVEKNYNFIKEKLKIAESEYRGIQRISDLVDYRE